MITCVLNADSDRYADTSIVNESVREIIIISTINLFLLLRSAFWQFRTITVSESCLIKLLPYILFEKYIHNLALETASPGEPALCQLYRHTFVAA